MAAFCLTEPSSGSDAAVSSVYFLLQPTYWSCKTIKLLKQASEQDLVSGCCMHQTFYSLKKNFKFIHYICGRHFLFLELKNSLEVSDSTFFFTKKQPF